MFQKLNHKLICELAIVEDLAGRKVPGCVGGLITRARQSTLHALFTVHEGGTYTKEASYIWDSKLHTKLYY